MWSPLNQAHDSPQANPALWGGEVAPGPGGWPSAADMLQQSAGGMLGPGGAPQSPSARGPSPAWPAGPPGAADNPGHSAASKIYVQGLPQSLQHPVAVAGLFAPFGDVLDVKLYAAEVRLSGGSAVVRMRTVQQAAAAIAALNGVVPDGGWQQLTVRAAETAEQRSSRISAINGRQGLGPPSPAALPPAGAASLRRAQSARAGSSAASLQCYTGGLLGSGADLLAVAAAGGAGGRRSVDWPLPGGSAASLDSRRSSMDAARCGRSSSDSGSDEAGAMGGALGSPAGLMQRMLLEAVLALVAQVEAGQLSLPAMRSALENALSAAKQATGGDEALAAAAATQTNNQGLTA